MDHTHPLTQLDYDMHPMNRRLTTMEKETVQELVCVLEIVDFPHRMASAVNQLQVQLLWWFRSTSSVLHAN